MRVRITIALGCALAVLMLSAMRAADPTSPEPPADATWTAVTAGTATITGGPGGPTVTITGSRVRGNGVLKFGEAAPRRFQIRLLNQRNMPTITLSDGTYSLQVSALSNGKSSVSFDKTGRTAGPGPNAVTVTVETTKEGHLDLHVACGKNVELGKTFQVNWTRALGVKGGLLLSK
jgi:hypothetical protein